MSFLRQLAGETFIYGSGHILPRVLNFLFLTPFLTSYLSQNEYGKHGIYYAFSGLLMILFTFRLETAFFRYGTNKENRDRYFSTAIFFILFISLILSFIIGSFSELAANILSTTADSRFVWYVLIMIVLDAMAAIPFARLRLEQKARSYAALKILNVLTIIGATMFLFFGLKWLTDLGVNLPPTYLDSTYYLDFVFIGNIIGSAFILFILLIKHFNFTLTIDREALGLMLKYAWPLIPVGIAGIINIAGDSLLIKLFLSDNVEDNLANSGIYTAAKRIAVIMSLFTTAFNYAVEPFFFRSSEKSDAKEMYARTAEAYTIVGCLIILSIIFYLDIFQYLLGKDLRGGLAIVPVALFAFLFLGLYYNFSVWYKLTDKTRYGMYIAITGAAITIIMNIILLPRIGFIASSIAALTCFMTMSALCIIIGRHHYRVPYDFGKIAFYLFLTLGCIGVSMIADHLLGFSTRARLLNNTVLLLGFAIIVYRKEKDIILKM